MSLLNFFLSKPKKLSVPRFQGRLYGFAWVIMEKRDPEYNGDKLKEEEFIAIVLKAMNFTTPEETRVITQLLDKIKTAHQVDEKQNELDSIKGALEGKLVIYDMLDINLLLTDNDINK